ncbi:replication restart DNA helicase PriA [Plantibacter sp. VKM Ac-1784]|uniref:Probable replication restart protein PriA n=1 Tax=Plantibacter elymi (nom. nud.) TaxID=199708 RepID=A0ABY1RAI2_9MICO|nr:primosomal protein N' [Plantibacter sp. VKM Ac-1784]SMQ66751.1 replication restart DNA helicase PriA [Plantibacter sp. VKM Ac-1784]
MVLDSPLPQLDHLFDYAIPDELADGAVLGARVSVPLRSAGRSANGFIVDLADSSEFGGALSPLSSVVSSVPVLTPALWTLARRIADRSAGSAMDVLRLAIPPRQVRVEKTWTAAAPPEPPSVERRTVPGFAPGTLDRLAPGERYAISAIPTLTATSAGVWLPDWSFTLAALAVNQLAEGRSAILCVPDYRDVEHLLAALDDLGVGAAVARADAKQTPAARYRSYLDGLHPVPRIVVGNRSAVYAPAHDLGLIALWDDGDPLHQEQLAPYVHARDVALTRQEMSGSALVFAGHSRSTETQRLVELGWLREVAPTPPIRPRVVVSRASGDDAMTSQARIPSSAWRAVDEALHHGPVLVQVARPGYAPHLACRRCGTRAHCSVCHGPLQLATARSQPSCRWCGHLAAGWSCETCHDTAFRVTAAGTGRTAEELGRAFPRYRVVVSDGDAPKFEVGPEPALVIATRGAEPVAAGGYAAVLLVDADRMLARESLRVAEDCLRWWSNAAALAAPRAPVLLIGVEAPVANAFALWQQPRFASEELAERRELGFPPAVRSATLTGTRDAVDAALAALPAEYRSRVLGPTVDEAGDSVAILRVDYGHARAVAEQLRATVVAQAAKRRRPTPGRRAPKAPPTLRVRFDDPEMLS